jgi:hypothetical protein
MTEFLHRIFGYEAPPRELGSDFLFAPSNFWDGFTSVLDPFGTAFKSYNISPTPVEADCRALFADWYLVAKAWREAAEQLDKELAA